MAALEREIRLDGQGIDEVSEEVGAFFEKTKLDRRSVLLARLSFESCLLELQEHFGPDAAATFWQGKRLGRPRLEVRLAGERFDPRADSSSEWERSLMENAGLAPTYYYRGGTNIVSLVPPLPELGSSMVSVFALMLGVAISFAGNYIPAQTKAMLLNDLVNPLVDAFVNMLSSVASPLIFFSVASGICGIGNMAALKRSGKALIGRFLGVNLMATVLALPVCILLLPITEQGSNAGESVLGGIVNLVLGLIPSSFVQPFFEGNTLQIVVLAAAVGVAVLAIGDMGAGIRKALQAFNSICQFLMELICQLLPGFIVVMMVSQSWSGTAGALLSSWAPILIAAFLIVGFLGFELVYTCVRHRLSIPRTFLALFPVGFTAFSTASSTAAFGLTLQTVQEQFGVDEDQASFGTPLGMVICNPSSSMLIMCVVLYSARMYGGGSPSIVWYAQLGLTCLLYAVAVPPVPGAMIACYEMIFSSLGIPAGALAVGTALDLLVDNPCICSNVINRILQVFSAAAAMGAVDEDKLAKLRK